MEPKNVFATKTTLNNNEQRPLKFEYLITENATDSEKP
jgi:hypothetical protein